MYRCTIAFKKSFANFRVNAKFFQEADPESVFLAVESFCLSSKG
ncbi:hypothetical protein NSE_0747 [Neorickettsia sennetsu str. Miyayama]|uniref:Uncharacterized protein n=1 Tax=Ehrlichia sennetsu (strain ATCC VR-367 / Miyayama) TaxID=222891 RepID=Q2GD23_EHRS3|nr:hypothetical protein NSE_0747 [Neorickettsia sennetsu str. Miyayama]